MSKKEASPAAPSAVYAYLRALIGTGNAWRSAAEIAENAGLNTQEGRNQVAKALWKLVNDGLVIRRLRAGTDVKECMASVDAASRRVAVPRPAPGRVAIKPPPAGGVMEIRAEPAPPPLPTPEAVEAVEKLVRSPTPALTLADVLEKHARSRMADRMEKAQADAVIATALESGPLEDSSGPIASDLAPEPGHEVDDTPDPVAEPDTETPDDPLDIELANVMEALQAPRRVPVHIHDLDKKLNVLSSIALCLPPITRRIVNGVVKDLERVHGS